MTQLVDFTIKKLQLIKTKKLNLKNCIETTLNITFLLLLTIIRKKNQK